VKKSKKPLYFGIGGAAVVILAFFLLIFPLFQKGNVNDDPFDEPFDIGFNTNGEEEEEDPLVEEPHAGPPDDSNVEYTEGEAGFKTSDLNIKMIEVNQNLSYGFDTDTGEFYVIDNFIAGKETAIFIDLDKPFDSGTAVKLYIERNDELVAEFADYELIDANTLLFHPGDISEVDAWAQGKYTFTFTMGDSIAKRTTELNKAGPMKALAVPMICNYGGEIISCTGDWKDGVTMLTALYPVARDDVEYVLGQEQDFSDERYDLKTDGGQRLTWRILCELQTPNNDYTMIIGFMPTPVVDNTGILFGYTYGGEVTVVSEADDSMMATVVHEIAHCYNIGDEYPSGGLNNILNAPPYGMKGYDYYKGRNYDAVGEKEHVIGGPAYGIPGSGSVVYDQQRAYWLEGRQIMGPLTSYMGNGHGTVSFDFWTSSDIWNHLFNVFTGRTDIDGEANGEATRTSGDGTPGEQITVLEIRGAFDTPGVFTPDPWYSYTAGDSSLTSNESGEYSAVVYDRNGQQLSITYFDVTDDYYKTTEEGSLLGSSIGIPIRIIIRFPDTASKVVIYQGSRAIYTENLSANAPVVNFICLSEGQALGNNVTLTWDASGADGNDLTFQIWYYRAPDDMYLVASDVNGNSLNVDLTKFPGSDSGWFGILATDGSRTGMSETPKVSVPFNAPDILTNIPDGKQYKSGDPINIQGRVKDPQDGWLLDGFEWYVNGKLVEGNGSSHLMLAPNTLTPGTYTITIKVTNSAGVSASRDYTIVVV